MNLEKYSYPMIDPGLRCVKKVFEETFSMLSLMFRVASCLRAEMM